ncbi:MAG: hypothetical protein PHQ75_09330, partial [Thermoguttaceae bacterium]|nr:hypothetical protein [Thermoguttaceae bacterium]
KYYEAIKPLTKLALNSDQAVYEAAVDGLRGVCDPDEPDLTTIFNLFLEVKDAKQADYIARAITYIAEKNPDVAKRANIILDCAAAKKNTSDKFVCKVLPLLGRLGGARVYAQVEAGMKSTTPEVAYAAFTALCNWPNAEHADALWNVVQASDKVLAHQALRAYIRVVTLPNKRPEAQTLAMLKKAMEAAGNDANRNLALSRSSVIRTMDTVNWAASFLDNPAMSETACKVIVSLAHHRFLRQPNKALFEPILLKVEKTTKDKKTAELAAKARMGM